MSEWRQWCEARGKRLGEAEDEGPQMDGLRARNLLLQNEKLEHALRVARREFVPVEEVESVGAALGMGVRRIASKLHTHATRLATVTETEDDEP